MAKKKDKGLFGGDRHNPADDDRRENAAIGADMMEECDLIDKELDQLRAIYELYFMGIEKTEPVHQKDKLRGRIRALRGIKIRRNTALKFKLQALQARIISLENYWGRVKRARENGTYHRDVQKARRRQLELAAQHEATTMDGTALPAENQARMGEEDGQSVDDLEPNEHDAHTADRGPKGKAKGGKGKVARPRVRSAEDLDEPKMRQLYHTYVTAKRRCGERVELRYEDMASSLKKQVPKLMKTTGARSIEFKVVIKKGSAVLKAIPKTK